MNRIPPDARFTDEQGRRLPSPVGEDVGWIVIRARSEEICLLRVLIEELLGSGTGGRSGSNGSDG